MFTPPPIPDDAPLVDDPTWRQVAQTYALALSIPLLLWTVANPLAGAAVLAATGATGLALRRVAAYAACLRNCGGFSLDLGDTARVTVTRPPARDACCPP